MPNLKIKEAALVLLAIPAYGLGWATRKAWRLIAFFIAAFQEGWIDG